MNYLKRGISLVLSLLLVVSMVMPSSADAKKAKAPKLNKTKLTLKVGESKTLKVKNTKKKVSWSSNKKKIATVSKKGKVKGKKKGKAVITAKVGKKKLKCNVTVNPKNSSTKKPAQKKISIASARILNSTTIEVVLSEAQQLPLSAFSVMGKAYSVGQYNYSYKLDSVTTSEQKTYTISLDADERISVGHTIKVTVSGLTGSGDVSKEMVYTGIASNRTSEYTYTGMVGEKVDYICDFEDGNGYTKIDSVKVPDGISYKKEKDYIRFTGTPKTAGVFKGSVVYIDELGIKYTHNVNWLFGSRDVLVGNMEDSYVCYAKNTSYTMHEKVYVSGGSGQYTYEIAAGSDAGARIDEDYYSDGSSSSTYIEFTNATQGDKTVNVKVTDVSDSSKSTIVKWNIHIVNTVSLKGRLLDAEGQPLQKNGWVQFENVDDSIPYTSYFSAYYDTSKKEYSVDLPVGTYSVNISFNDGDEYIKLSANYIVTKAGTKDFVLKKYYPVEITSSVDLSTATWKDEDNNWIGFGKLMYLQPGSYNLTANMFHDMQITIAKVSFTVKDSKVSVSATMSDTQSLIKGTITEEQPASVKLSYMEYNIYDYYKFVPQESGWYAFYSESERDTYGCLLNDSYETLYTDDDSGEDSNFRIVFECQAGSTYYVGIRAYSSSSMNDTAQLFVKKSDAPSDEDEDWDEDEDEE